MTPQSCRARSVIPAAACALAAALLAPAAAAQDSPLTLRLGRTLTVDENVFRQPDSVSDPQLLTRGLTGRSDRFTTTVVGLNIAKTYLQQHFLFSATETATRYDKFIFLDRNAFDYRGVLQWQLSPRITGTLSADRAQAIIGFEDTTDLQSVLTVTSNRNFSIDGLLFGGWHLLGGVSETVRQNSRSFVALPNFTQVSEEVGLKYLAASQSSITATRRSRQGTNTGQVVDFVGLFDNSYSVAESEVMATWIASAKSTLNGRLTRIERINEHIPQRDFSGVAGEFSYVWTPAGRLLLNFSAQRGVTPFIGTNSSYRVDDTLAFTPTWQISDKISLNMRASRLTTDYLGPVFPLTGPLRRDVIRSLQFGTSWTPHRSLTLSAILRRDGRSSTDPTLTFQDTVGSLSAFLTF